MPPGSPTAAALSVAAPGDRQARMREMLGTHLRFVARTLTKAGVPPSELDDEVQRTFIVAAGRLEDVRPGAEKSFLFQVALHTAAHTRRTLARRREVPTDRLPDVVQAAATPEDLALRRQTREMLHGIVETMDESLRAAWLLFEVEGMDTVEIAARLGIPRGTVASRLRRARDHLRRNLVAVELAWELGVSAGGRIQEPVPLRRQQATPLTRALLAAGTLTGRSSARSVRVLTVCRAAAG